MIFIAAWFSLQHDDFLVRGMIFFIFWFSMIWAAWFFVERHDFRHDFHQHDSSGIVRHCTMPGLAIRPQMFKFAPQVRPILSPPPSPRPRDHGEIEWWNFRVYWNIGWTLGYTEKLKYHFESFSKALRAREGYTEIYYPSLGPDGPDAKVSFSFPCP